MEKKKSNIFLDRRNRKSNPAFHMIFHLYEFLKIKPPSFPFFSKPIKHTKVNKTMYSVWE